MPSILYHASHHHHQQNNVAENNSICIRAERERDFPNIRRRPVWLSLTGSAANTAGTLGMSEGHRNVALGARMCVLQGSEAGVCCFTSHM